MKIIDKIQAHQREGTHFFSFEYFPPKTDEGVQNLFDRLDRMASFEPLWIDVTWGAGGSTAQKTIEICSTAQKVHPSLRHCSVLSVSSICGNIGTSTGRAVFFYFVCGGVCE